ncbi:hypothetical protein PFISCL1PPCAC_18675, partial [Pristionchus fissidentatus]
QTSLFDDEYIDGAEQLKEEEEALTPPTPTELKSKHAAVTCRKITSPCQRCPDLKVSDVCPGGAEKGCTDITVLVVSPVNMDRPVAPIEIRLFQSYHLMRWNTLNSYIECSATGEWKMPRGAIIPNHAEVRCKYNGECECAGARLGTSSACKTTWETGCDFGAVDLFAKEGECSIIRCRYNGKLAIFKPGSSEYVKTLDG